MRSPEYKTPIMNYIDEKCSERSSWLSCDLADLYLSCLVVFDDDEENKLEFTKIHEEFVELVFG